MVAMIVLASVLILPAVLFGGAWLVEPDTRPRSPSSWKAYLWTYLSLVGLLSFYMLADQARNGG